MRSRPRELRLGCLLLGAAVASSCATVERHPTLTLEQHSLRIPLTVGANGSVSLAGQSPLTGRIDLSPILTEEGIRVSPTTVTTIQIMVLYGRFYVVGDGFHSVWELTPRPGTSSASYRRIPITPTKGETVLKGARLSRYGSAHTSCLRLDRKAASPVFISAQGQVSRACP